MGRIYNRQTSKADWTAERMHAAIIAIQSGKKIREVSRTFNIPESTIRDRLKNSNLSSPKLGRKSTFSFEVEQEFAKHIIKLAKYFYGITPIELRRLAYDYAISNNIENRFSKETKLAGYDWLKLFLKRNPGISLRTPEGTSLNRVTSFNETNVKIFYNNLEATMDKYELHNKPTHIYNVDESGFTTVQKPSKILGPRGQKQVGSMISWERGKNVTVVCCMSAGGSFVPPMIIYPRAKLNPLLQRNGPAGAIYQCSKNGWITNDLFFKWIEHFANVVKPTINDPVLLIFDNHTTHISIEVYNFCKSNGICIVTLPPHTSHKLQPLDLTFFGPFKAAFNRECDLFLKSHPHEKISMYDLASILNKSYIKIATLDKGISGFSSSGIYPLDTNKFSQDDFAPAQEYQTVILETDKKLHLSNVQRNLLTAYEVQPDNIQRRDMPSTSTGIYHESISLESLHPVPKANPPATQGRESRKRKSIILTDSPMKNELEETKKKQQAAAFKKSRAISEKKKKPSKLRVKKLTKVKVKTPKRAGQRNMSLTSDTTDDEENSESYVCLVCGEVGGTEIWYRCRKCGLWAHALCTSNDSASTFICDFCQ